MHLFLEFFQQIPAWLNAHQQWIALVTFLIAFAESVAIIGLFIPGSSTLITIGFFIGAGHLPLLPIFITTTLGSFLGDLFSYAVGRRYHHQLRQKWPFTKFTKLFDQGEQFFQKYGGKSVFLGRFIRPLHPTIPIIAGMMNLSWRPFLIADAASAAIWSPACFVPGILVGYGLIDLPPAQAELLLISSLVGLLGVLFVYAIVRKIGLHYYQRVWNFFQQRWQHVHSSFWRNLLRDAEQPKQHRQLSVAIWLLLTGISFLLLFIAVRFSLGITSLNQFSHQGLLAVRHPSLVDAMVVISFFGQKAILIPIVIATILYCGWQKHWRLALHWLGLLVIAGISVWLFKHLSHSPRPSDILNPPSNFSFPSGHVTFTVAIWGFLAYLLQQRCIPSIKHWPITVVALLTFLVAFSRLYLGVHWFTDVVGAILLGLTCVFATVISYRREPTVSVKLTYLLPIIAVVFLLATSIYSWKYYQQHVSDYQPVSAVMVFEPSVVIGSQGKVQVKRASVLTLHHYQ